MRRLIHMIAALMISATGSLAEGHMMKLTPDWEYVADTVMGGVSRGQITPERVEGRDAMRLTGAVSLENNGGFVQMAFDLAEGAVVDASGWSGIEVDVLGNGASYEIRLRTDQLSRPWQSFRAAFETSPAWQTVRLPWSAFEARKTDVPFDPARLKRIGVLAIGAEMLADIAVADIRFYQ